MDSASGIENSLKQNKRKQQDILLNFNKSFVFAFFSFAPTTYNF